MHGEGIRSHADGLHLKRGRRIGSMRFENKQYGPASHGLARQAQN